MFVQTGAFFGSTEAYLLDLMEALDRTQFAPVVLAPDSAALDPLRKGLAALNVPCGMYDASLPGRASIAVLRRRIRAQSPDLIHVGDMSPGPVIAAKLARSPVVVTFHTPELVPTYNPRGRLMMRAAAVVPDAIIFSSRSDLETAISRWGVSRKRARVVPLGINTSAFSPRRSDPRSGLRVGTIARLSPQKDPSTLIDAFEIVARKSERPVTLDWLGDGELRPEVDRLIDSKGLRDRVRIVTRTEDVPAFLNGLDVFLLASRFEGLCYAVIEAMACGVPVVATRVGGIRDSVIDGETGVLVAPGDPDALARAALELLDDPTRRKAMGERARVRVQSAYSTAAMTHGTFSLYRTLTEGTQ